MVKKGSATFLLVFLLCISFSLAFEFNGTTYTQNGQALNASVNVTMYDTTNNFAYVGYNATTANATGWFNITVTENNNWLYSVEILYTNESVVTYVGQKLPYFPSQVLTDIAGTRFYLREAGTIFINAVNQTGGAVNFTYQIKDQKLGYVIADTIGGSGGDTQVYQKTVYVPRDRNYTVMIYPFQSMPVSWGWNNFSASSDYTFNGGLSTYNTTTYTLNKTFNMTMSYARVHGYLNVSQFNKTWEDITIVPYILETGDLAHASFGTIPYNLSFFFDSSNPSDIYNLTSGYYNISLPSTVEVSSMLLFAVAKNGTNYYGGFQNLSLNYSLYSNGDNLELNFTYLFGLLGDEANITLEGVMGDAGKNVSVRLQSFNLLNESDNTTLSNIYAHIEADLDYTAYGVTEFTWMNDVEQSANATFTLPLLNVTGIDEMNVFVGGGNFEPVRKSYTAAQIIANNNITISEFNPGDIDGTDLASSIYVSFYLSNSTCDVPNPGSECTIGSSESMDTFNPMSAIFGGGKISFRMGLASTGIEVHYVNVDMLASGPPSALFDDETSESTSGDFASALRFGSGGPTIYDYILISMPYTEGSTSTTGLNESVDVNLSIPILYDDSWNVIWNVSVNGSNGTNLGGNFSHYEQHASQWGTLLGNNTCTTNVSLFNATNPCYINTTANKVWVRIPHFSGAGPQLTGQVVTAATSNNNDNSGGGGSSTSGDVTIPITKENFEKGYTRNLRKGSLFRLIIDGNYHYIRLKNVTSTEVILNITSDPIIVTLKPGEEKIVDVDADDISDLKVTLHGISGLYANITVIKFIEPISENTNTNSDTTENQAADDTAPTTGAAFDDTTQTTEPTSSKGILIMWIVIVIAIVVALIFFFKDSIKAVFTKKK